MKKTFYDLQIYDNKGLRGVLEDDIKKLPFYDYWKEVSIGSTYSIYTDPESGNEYVLIYLHDWEKFCRLYEKEKSAQEPYDG